MIAASAFVAVAAIATYLPAWEALENKAFDFLTVHTAKGEISQPIMIVAINEEAMNAMKMRLPWPRSLYAELINRLAQGGASVIALDVLFAEPSDEDPKLAAAIARAGNVVLSAVYTYDETAAVRMWKRVDPLDSLVAAGGVIGLARIEFNPHDQFVRGIPGNADAFWRQIVKVLQLKEPARAVPGLPDTDPDGHTDALIKYPGPNTVFDPVPFHIVMKASPEELKGAFNGKIVLVGRELQATAELGMAQADLFSTPFLAYSKELTAGVRIHATVVDNALSGTWLRPLGPVRNLGLGAVAALLAFLTMRRWRPLLATVAVIGIIAAFAGATWYMFAYERLWMAFAAPVATALTIYMSFMARAYVTENRRKRDLQRAFSRYVSPDVVAQIVDNPNPVTLGGQRREITVMFTDLAGFTTLTEKTAPEVVQQVLARHFTMLTRVIFAHKGTVVQFMGDGLMAFWNAPLNDPDHALNAVKAAIDGQKGMDKLRGELREAGLPEIKMRVGVNTCEAAVGNFGSETQLAYTAMGDGVNLTSRLEGANKLYGTPILVSGETVAKIGGKLPMRRVDRIKVAGKSMPVDVFTPIEDANRVERTAIAFEAYVRGDLETATAIYAELRLTDEEDQVAARMLDRIEKRRSDPALVGEDGSIALDKM